MDYNFNFNYSSTLSGNSRQIEATQYSVLQVAEFYIKSIEPLIGRQIALNTVRKYKSILNSLKRYLNGTDVPLSDLNYAFVSNYFTHLLALEGLQPNSAFKNIKCLNRIMHYCILNKWIISNPFSEFKCSYKQPDRPYLTEAEILSLYSKKLNSDRHCRVRDLFLFQTYTGLAYADMQGISRKNFEIGIDGKQWLILNRQKTGIKVSVPILPIAKEILINYDYNLPKISNQKMNIYLKEVAAICNITKKLTSHCGRHSFATTITLSHNVPIETVSRLLGHTDLRTTQIYAKVTDAKIADDMKHLF